MGLHCAIVSSSPTQHPIGNISPRASEIILLMRDNYICIKLKAPAMVRQKTPEKKNVESAAFNTLASNEVTD